jgi:hypothetical protein
VWIYEQASGRLLDPSGVCVGVGYAGRGIGKNNPAMQQMQMIGPLPQGDYLISAAYHHPKLGPVTMDLTPDASNHMFGRSLFRIHPDAIDHPGSASEGCICAPHSVRNLLAASEDRHLRVVA